MNHYCGIDLGAKRSQICIIDEDQKVLVNRKIANDMTTIDTMLKPYRASLETVVESTFNWYWIVDGLQELGYQVKLAHTLKLAAIAQAKVKTDRRDALILAQLLRARMIPESYIYPVDDRHLRDLVRKRWNLVAMRADELRRLRGLLYRNGICHIGTNDVRTMGEEEANALLSHPLTQKQASLEIQRVEFFSDQIRDLEKDILRHVRSRSGYKNLMTIPGIGPILAITILLEIGEISRFSDARHFASYCRVAPGCANSGDSSKRSRANKQGNPYLKWALTQAAGYSARFDRDFRAYFDRVRAKHAGASGIVITHCTVAHRIALAVFHVLRDNSPFCKEKLFRTTL